METVSLYTFEDRDGCEQTFMTFDARKAEETVKENGWICFANEYVYVDREVAWDWTGNQVLWAACEEGYLVQVFKGGEEEPVEEYRAGNSPKCSQTYVRVSERSVSLEQLSEFAERTARELAKKHHVSVLEGVCEDAGVLEKLQEELAE